MNKLPVVWTIGASDSSGGSGIQADLHTFHDFSVHGCTVITALNAQNSFALGHTAATSIENFNAQILALNSDMPAAAIKLGAMPNREIVESVAAYLSDYKGFVVYDLELDNSGEQLLDEAADVFPSRLFSLVDLVVANTDEVKILADIEANCAESIVAAGEYFLKQNARSVLITGARISEGESKSEQNKRYDYWTDGDSSFWLTVDAIPTSNNQGGGCTLSAAVAALVGSGTALAQAIELAKAYVTQGIRGAQQQGSGPGAVAHLGVSDSSKDLPQVSDCPPM